MPERDRLDQNIADRRRLYRTRYHLALGGVGSEFIEDRVPTSTTNDVQPPNGATGDLLNFLQSDPVQKGGALQNTTTKLTRCFLCRLPGFQTIVDDSLRHIAGLDKSHRSRVNQRTKWLGALGLMDQAGIVQLTALFQPLPTAFLQ